MLKEVATLRFNLTAQVMGDPFCTVQCKEYCRHSTCHCKSCNSYSPVHTTSISSIPVVLMNLIINHILNEGLSSYQSLRGNKQLLSCYLFSDI